MLELIFVYITYLALSQAAFFNHASPTKHINIAYKTKLGVA